MQETWVQSLVKEDPLEEEIYRKITEGKKVQMAAAAAAAKSLQSCPTLCNPIDGSPRGSPIPGILQAGSLEWVAFSLAKS